MTLTSSFLLPFPPSFLYLPLAPNSTVALMRASSSLLPHHSCQKTASSERWLTCHQSRWQGCLMPMGRVRVFGVFRSPLNLAVIKGLKKKYGDPQGVQSHKDDKTWWNIVFSRTTRLLPLLIHHMMPLSLISPFPLLSLYFQTLAIGWDRIVGFRTVIKILFCLELILCSDWINQESIVIRIGCPNLIHLQPYPCAWFYWKSQTRQPFKQVDIARWPLSIRNQVQGIIHVSRT